MTGSGTAITGIVLGLLFGFGLTLIVWQLPWLRARDLATRVDPYLRRSRSASLFAAPSTASRTRTVLENLMGPIAIRVLSVLERLTGGPEQLERRLRLAGRRTSTDSFRVEQVAFGAAGLAVGVVVAIAAIGLRDSSLLLGLVLVVLGAVCGVLLRDYLLGAEIKRRAARMAREFPTVADLLALAVAA
ncbi:MAG: type II secretion system F family protein, partial [Brachybacterium sp.]